MTINKLPVVKVRKIFLTHTWSFDFPQEYLTILVQNDWMKSAQNEKVYGGAKVIHEFCY